MDLDLQIPCHTDRSMSGYFLVMDDMSPDYGTAMKGQWKADIMEVSKYDIERAHRATGAVTECNLYERNDAHGETNGWNQLNHSRRWIMAGT